MEVDDDNIDSGSEYVTLACQFLSSTDKIETVHLRVNFHDAKFGGDRDTYVMQACAVIVGEGEINKSGVYEGVVSMNEAAVESRYSSASGDLEMTTKDKSISIWLQDARAALTQQCVKSDDVDNFEKHDTKYVYCLQVQSDDDPETVILSWKIKHKFFTIALGSICLSKVTASSEIIGQMSVKFLKPLICSLLTEKKHNEEIISASSKTKDQLLADNQRLIDQLKLMTESRQHDDERMIARFLKILNTKKQRIAEIQHELSQLKQQQKVENSIPTIQTDEEKLLTVTSGGRKCSTGRCHDRYKKTISKAKIKDNNLDNNDGMAFKKQKTEHMNVHQHFMPEPTIMDMDVSTVAAVNEEVKEFPVVDNLTVNPFEANTQIDPVSDNSSVDSSPESPSFLQPSSPIQLPEQLPIQLPEQMPILLPKQLPIQLPEQLPMQLSPQQQPPERKSVLDSLWDGIL